MRARNCPFVLGLGLGLMWSCSDPDGVSPDGDAGDGNAGAGGAPTSSAGDADDGGAPLGEAGTGHGGRGDAGAGGTEAVGGAGGTESVGGAGGTESVGGAGGTESVGGAGGTESVGGAGGAGGAGDGVVWLGACTPLGLSADGETVLAAEGLWTATAGWQMLPDLPGGATSNTPRVLSANGQVVFGNAGSALGNEAYRWTAAGGIVGLGVTYPPLATSHDGSAMVGLLEDDEAELLPFRWTQAGGVLNLDPNHIYNAEDSDLIGAQLTADGKTAFFSFGEYPAMWTETNGLDDCFPSCSAGDTEFTYQDHITAINDAGTAVALFPVDDHQLSITGTCLFDTDPDEDACEAGSSCGCSWVAIFDYDASGNSAVGIEFAEGFPRTDIPELYTAFYWSKDGGMRQLDDVLPAGSGIKTYPGASDNDEFETWHPVHPYLNADGSIVLAQDTVGNCFLAPIAP